MPRSDKSRLHVSRETSERLRQYESLLRRWTAKVQLVAPSTVADIWERHIRDSLQLLDHAPESGTWLDMGSGAGLPGIVVAIAEPGRAVICVESDQRKAAFLRAAVRELGLSAQIRSERLETMPPVQAEVVSARALAPLPALLAHVHRHRAPSGTALLHKGATWRQEVAAARQDWHFALAIHPSQTHPDAVILQIGDLRRA